MIVRLENFIGIAPKFNPQTLPSNAAQVASNCRMESGTLRPIYGLTALVSPSIAETTKSLFLYNRTSDHWFRFSVDTDVVRSPLANDAYDRAYWSDGAKPKMTANDAYSVGGGSAYPITFYDLGIPAPTSTGTANETGGTGTEVDATDRNYVVTYVSAYGEEGPPSDVSNTVSVYPDSTVNLTSLPTGPVSGNHNLTSKRIYRTNLGSSETEYQLVATVSLATTSYADTLSDAELGVVLPSTEWDAPPDTLHGMRSHPGGFLVGFSGRDLCFSETYLPHAWPVSYRIPLDDKIIAIGLYGSSILVATEGLPVVVTGADPSSMTVEKAEVGDACVSKRGTVDLGYVVIYPSRRGLVAAGVGMAPQVITEDLLTEREWGDYDPESFVAFNWHGRYVAFYDNGVTRAALIFDPKARSLTTTDTWAEAGYCDQYTGDLYLKPDGATALSKFDDDDTSVKTLTWHSKTFRAPYPMNLGAIQVFADGYPITVKVYADGVLKHTYVASNRDIGRLPSGFLADLWEFEISGTNGVVSVHVANTAGEMIQV